MTDTKRATKWLLSCILCLCVAAWGCAERRKGTSDDKAEPRASSESTSSTATQDPTNTGINVRDRDSAAKTPTDQYENSADIKTTADIRKRVVDAKMSIDAHNVKIITQDGKVTLRGPVKTEEEKRTIEKIATDVAGSGRVDNKLEVHGD